MDKKIISIRDTTEYDSVNKELMEVIKKYDLNYVEALGCLSTLKSQIFDAFLNEEEK